MINGYRVSDVITFQGRCDASGGFALDKLHWVGGDDEKNKLLLYSVSGGVGELALDFLGLAEDEEADRESATRVGSVAYWIGSHSAKTDGTKQPGRRRIFAVEVSGTGASFKITPTGRPFARLIESLDADPQYAEFHLSAAAERGSNLEGALSIESLCASSSDELLIGFRNPIPAGTALIAVVRNPGAMIKGDEPEFGPPLRLDLDGLGIRDMTRWREGYLLIGGDFRDGDEPGARMSRLFFWDGNAKAPEELDVIFPHHFNPEALVLLPGGDGERVLVCSDDGGFACTEDGTVCKKLKKDRKQERRFRTCWLESRTDGPDANSASAAQ